MGTLLGKEASGISFYLVLNGHSFGYRGPESKLNDEADSDNRGCNLNFAPARLPRIADLRELMFGYMKVFLI
jgi:hypothetical protein